ncbi:MULTISPECIES: class I SAM-dependent methyltransferase [Paenibacillus]|uniref:SAM-dependent methyltransferase n=1 Tax=Paenibacillus odorifer TaxID=189426 RepID=A0A1R0X956_9BACL|nr:MULTISPECIES: class I SAM-dependent methyltransferase [Paenibacillus]AIQ72892.1 SAM-dependent methyltransferase [Paenibacillus odorifer]ETT64132.1 putative rRNA methylase [Paenibacillus sp. FSL H8-237]MEC0132539.1 class I SAM-dependent methyltransferase [Paenibacillus odorifer]MEC0225214.1 class I SAM-dependent methyltransferase [Paenibacillus odorifer]OMC92181.1 SAM-dependent methyltransferase [Paenibacillus odorifer]
MGFMSVLSFAHKLISERLTLGDRAIDATVGTGADTLFLAKTTGARGEVYGFDIQAAALKLAEERLRLAREETSSLSGVTLLERSHAEMAEAVPANWPGTVGAVMFNLGYLPSGDADKNIITEPDSSIAALEASLQLLRPGGIITAVLYPGHAGGDLEAAAVEAWATTVSPKVAQSIVYRQLQRTDAPYVIALEKKKGSPS